MNRVVACVVVVGLAVAAPARAQNLGTFRWQLQPHCNVITVNIEQKGSTYVVSGSDDQCNSSGGRAAVTGTAFGNPDGSIGMGLTVVSPAGVISQVAANIQLATVSGTWRDGHGNNGGFIFGPSVGSGTPRPNEAVWHEVGAPGEPAFGVGWQNGTPPYICLAPSPSCPVYNTAAFSKDSQGIVRLKGSLAWSVVGGSSTAMFRLPAGYRSARASAFLAQGTLTGCPSSNCRFVIYDGYVQLSSGGSFTPGTYFFSIDGISFRADQ